MTPSPGRHMASMSYTNPGYFKRNGKIATNRNLKFSAPKTMKTPIIFPSPGLPGRADPGPIYPAGDVRGEESGNGVTPSN